MREESRAQINSGRKEQDPGGNAPRRANDVRRQGGRGVGYPAIG